MMEFLTTKHKLPDKCDPTDWLNVAIKNTLESINGYIEVGFSQTEAIRRVKKESCAGPKVWALILSQ